MKNFKRGPNEKSSNMNDFNKKSRKIRFNEEKKQEVANNLKGMHKESIEEIVREEGMHMQVEMIDRNYALVMLYDPYGNTGKRHAKTLLVVKGKGLIDLGYHNKVVYGAEKTQDFVIDDVNISYNMKDLLVEYKLAERKTVEYGSGGKTENKLLYVKSHNFKLNQESLDLPVEEDMYIDYIINKEKEHILSPGNLKPTTRNRHNSIEKGPINYGYAIEKFQVKYKNYVMVSNIIDLESYTHESGATFTTGQQVRTTVYEVDKEEESLKKVSTHTTDTNDRMKYCLVCDHNKGIDEVRIRKPEIIIRNKEIVVTYKVKGINSDMDEKSVTLPLK